MGGLCSKVSAVDKSPSDTALGWNQVFDHEPAATLKEEDKSPVSREAATKPADELQQQSFSFMESVVPGLAVHNGADVGHTGSRTPQLARTLSQKAGLGKTKVRRTVVPFVFIYYGELDRMSLMVSFSKQFSGPSFVRLYNL